MSDQVTDYISAEEWKKAEVRLTMIEEEYRKLIGAHGVNPHFAINLVLKPIRARFNNGERTRELYEEIMGLE